ncbi:hypothetical protein EMIHUDRAFT_229509 [Emiliania huxleyi CCMP1516]|uniref:Uncharacterized protein n=2 Tax=Emiliania huxleyi TaxID=2903 RepID=A0A0D3KCU1_EMIH1|nr:hypothetical protein EMIHUDRAFT_229509 [Emiliania huxleyi CCMP1516]EOD33576.1 hypothetical protein EMIHUDRAFT_229509 [Emiliania huxleyi CCMP1516]|eukprot:XP_005786005.1 hypothetical protein EMIHUDRAFT_229509 [Emiliania huxleyi CCMP1516]
MLVTGRHWIEDDGAARLEATEKGIVERRGDCYEFRGSAGVFFSMAAHRIGARVAGLSPEQLCAIIEAQAGASDAALCVAEEHAARLVEQPEWVLSEVLLSPDLAPHILAQLPTKAHAAKGTIGRR